ncbi:MAG: lamin tail domain-containing protein [Bacteroidota bacterium]
MKKLLLLCIFCVHVLLSNAQFVDNFSDGNIDQNPTWLGDTSLFVVNTQNQLQLNANEVGTATIYAPVNIGDSTTWELYFRLGFDPSNNNRLKIILKSDNFDLKNNFNGYFLQIGRNGADDRIELLRQDGTSTNSDPILSSAEGSVAIAPEARLRVIRDPIGNWELYADFSGGNALNLLDQGFDDTYNFGQFFGMVCDYTSNNLKEFFIDDIRIDPLYVDDDGPILVNAVPENAERVEVFFDEALDSTSAQQIENYSINNGIDVLSADLQADAKQVRLMLSPLTSGQFYELTIENILDTLDNPAPLQSTSFQYINVEPADRFDILINEIYADLSPPVALPDGKFIELYNRSEKYINLNGFILSDAVNSTSLPDYLMFPNSYVIICDEDVQNAYSALGTTIGLPSFPTPNVSGDDMSLRNSSGQLIHSVSYEDDWYQDEVKEAGGWTLELINPNLFCVAMDNWRASNDPSGGSPGRENSVFLNIPDNNAPSLVSALALSDRQVLLSFDELLDEASASSLFNYDLMPNAGFFESAVLQGDGQSIILTLEDNFADGVTYDIEVTNVRDCPGNPIGVNNSLSFTFYITQPASRYDILINEIYADPSPSLGLPEREYIELYNRSDKVINLEDFAFDRGSGNPVALPFFILLPDSYVILQRNDVFVNFASFGEVVMLPSFSLSNEGDTLQLMDPSGLTVDAVAFLRSWHDDGKSDGGFSLERINPNTPCLLGNNNWKSSSAPLGGTPGTINSVFDEQNSDTTGPDLIKAYVSRERPDQVRLFFSEALEELSAINPDNYQLDAELEIVDLQLEAPLYNSVLIQFLDPIEALTIYELTLSNAIDDCLGNPIGANNQARFALAQDIEPFDIVLNEILYDPETGGSRFVEIYNRSDKVIDAFDLILAKRNELGDISFLSPISEPCLLFPDQYLVLTPSPEDIQSRYFAENPAAFLTTDVPTYDDRQDAVVLTTSGAVLVDELQYQRDFHNELLDNPEGVSLERINPDGITQSDDNWHSAAASVGHATPSYQNSQFVANPLNPGSERISLPSKTVSPDDDGFEDILLINYQTDTPGFLATLNIYDARGRLVRQLVRNELLASQGSFKWDGTNEDQTKARIGIYVLWGSLTHPDGTKEEIKESIIVAGRLD